ncbi:S1C family serine protease [Ornithinimicrobium panacihumi]|uniref:S1C family serine protease n=1 Tax=Ornithinimicrobium panacihumi TaxID=2008449 RepID=UPI003F89FB53
MTDPTVPVPVSPRRATRPRSQVPVVLASFVAGAVGGLGGGVIASNAMGSGPSGQTSTAPTSDRATEPSSTAGAGTPATAAPHTEQDASVTEGIAPVPADGTIAGLSRSVLPSVALVALGPEGRDGQGSGFVIRDDGYVLTNHHVIAASTTGGGISVHLPGREPIEAEVVGSDPVYDIAVLKVEAQDLAALPFADSDEVEVGQTVVAVGAPLGLDSTVTSGIVSALNRPVVAGEEMDVSYINAIQTDAAINPGNSGGPLLDLAGHVVGVNSAIAQLPSSSFGPAGSIGLGFAIPADQASRTAEQIIETGSSQHPVIGVHVDVRYTGEGARVMGEGESDADPVIPGGPAEAAGLRPGEVILSVDGTRISDYQHLLVVLRSREIGEQVELEVRAGDGRERTVRLTLAGSGG